MWTQDNELEALVKACKYSAVANKLGFCGPRNAFKVLYGFVKSPLPEKAGKVKALLKRFNALFPYLKLIASANSLKPFSKEVIEAYWLGNSLLERVSQRELQKTVLCFQRFGLPRNIVDKACSTLALAPNALPHHSFHVLFLNFINPSVRPLVKNLGNCLIQWAKVEEATSNSLKVHGIELFSESGWLKLKEKNSLVRNPFALEPVKGSFVSVHWGNAIELLSSEQARLLKRITLENIDNHALLH